MIIYLTLLVRTQISRLIGKPCFAWLSSHLNLTSESNNGCHFHFLIRLFYTTPTKTLASFTHCDPALIDMCSYGWTDSYRTLHHILLGPEHKLRPKKVFLISKSGTRRRVDSGNAYLVIAANNVPCCWYKESTGGPSDCGGEPCHLYIGVKRQQP